MAFYLEQQLQILKQGEEMKIKVDWNDYRVNNQGELGFAVAIRTTSGQIWNPLLSVEDFKHLGFDLTGCQNWMSSGIPTDGRVTVAPGLNQLQKVKILWERSIVDSSGHIRAVMGKVITPEGISYLMTVETEKFNDFGFKLHGKYPLLIRFMPKMGTEGNHMKKVNTASSVPVRTKDPIQMKKSGNNLKLAKYKEKKSKRLDRDNRFFWKLRCEICNWGEHFPSRMERHKNVHVKNNNPDYYFCEICKRNFRSTKDDHILYFHDIAI